MNAEITEIAIEVLFSVISAISAFDVRHSTSGAPDLCMSSSYERGAERTHSDDHRGCAGSAPRAWTGPARTCVLCLFVVRTRRAGAQSRTSEASAGGL